jgi:uncharacterized SAM-binding protein YcdF (DUF218 family)
VIRAWRKRPGFYICVFFLMGFGFAFGHLYRIIASQPISSWTDDVSADCAVVLTGGSNRVREGMDLLSRGQVKKLIISGVYANANLRDIFPLWPFYGEVSEKDVVLDRRSTTTYGNAQQTLPIVEALGCRDVALITSNVHMYRAFRTFLASYPPTVQIQQFAVNTGKVEASPWEISTEVLKSMFYSTWAY